MRHHRKLSLGLKWAFTNYEPLEQRCLVVLEELRETQGLVVSVPWDLAIKISTKLKITHVITRSRFLCREHVKKSCAEMRHDLCPGVPPSMSTIFNVTDLEWNVRFHISEGCLGRAYPRSGY